MTFIKKSIFLVAGSLFLAGCSTTSSNTSAGVFSPSKWSTAFSSLSRDKKQDPNHEALAQQIITATSEKTYNKATDTLPVWGKPLDLSRPIPDDLYQVLREGFTFDLTIEDSRVDAQLRWYARHQSYLNRVSDRASRYMYHIVTEIEARDMPLELALLPIVESAFDPFAYSHGSASGMWQFIASTGRMYGLQQDWWYDGRRDVVASTDAALNYLEDLNRMFKGDWLLALASYNSGPGTVLRAQRRNRAAGKPTDFWHLDLPKETEAYVPKLIALAKLFSEPEKYGITLPKVANEPFFAEVDTGGQIDLAQAATLADMNLSDLYILNPSYNRWATAPQGPHKLLVFKDRADLFNQRIAELPANQRLTWKRYTIESGDSLLSIAHQHEVTVDVLKDVNNINGNLIRAGHTLLIPVASKNDNYYSMSAENRLKIKQNALAGSSKQRIDYTVQSGDSFWSISRKFGVSTASVAKWNNMAPKDVLKVGQQLVIWSDSSSSASALDSRQVVRKVGYVVRRGDSLYRIADKFSVRVSDIQKWNQISSNQYLQPGDRLTLYVDVTRIQ
ncbi:lytic transglycosylase [Reinekea thalattae]|uniref:LysM peptidoglycan-binding domain-containing protein n=1 Tax=Reinekea thalattae TaxID=2593301 RepID=A0A5C8Z8C4_9GAMM|nr:LysM peptidoglycan-binding domain-containing protein [Reinekea thalattae]TXR53579.1 LysM peptidoglycan-binding domain-containing protein [Reinekea thalattae]